MLLNLLFIFIGLLGMSLASWAEESPARPNFLVVVVDDMGWSDTEPFGGEIRTPNIAALAKRGLAMTDFYVAPTCSPTRAMLLTGVDHHRVGLGTMEGLAAPNQRHLANYQGALLNNNATIAEVFEAEGYNTYLSGKWHLGDRPEQLPGRRGFQRSFALMEGGASHFADRLGLHQGVDAQYLEDGEPVELTEDFYSSVTYTDKLLEFMRSDDKTKPFFAYLAYTAPHDPLQVPEEWLDRYRGHYDLGPVHTRQQRLKRQQTMGLVAGSAELWQMPRLPSWLPGYKEPWKERSVSQRRRDARPMEIYAAMVELLDEQVGRVIASLEESGQLDNTYIIFFSDNGSNAATPLMYPNTRRQWFIEERDHLPENLGKQGSHAFLGSEWALASGTPWRLFKGTIGEGGIRSPLIVAGPGISENKVLRRLGHVQDLASTVYELADIDWKQSPVFKDKLWPSAHSLAAVWRGQSKPDPVGKSDRSLEFELFGNTAVRMNRWKASRVLPPIGSGQWELYDLSQDPGETIDLAAAKPALLWKLIEIYEKYADNNGVVQPHPNIMPNLSKLYTEECNWWCELKFYFVNQAIKWRSS